MVKAALRKEVLAPSHHGSDGREGTDGSEEGAECSKSSRELLERTLWQHGTIRVLWVPAQKP